MKFAHRRPLTVASKKGHMKKQIALLYMLVMSGFLVGSGCSIFRGDPIDADADPAIVHAQRTRNNALDTFNKFLAWEKNNRALLNSPPTKAAADLIRTDYKKWDDGLGQAIVAYSAVKNTENATKLDIALSLIQQGLQIASQYSRPNLSDIAASARTNAPPPLP